ncbi:acetoacetate decarboxylase family protein [Nitriliruptor alkaliphilus]|uniref:acetoacetate decarboxylase family protein n=1 Tax=Nitriliruptor alkaliphilus TaxID=427918 RepID=UPI0006988494|nr:acetoacetate decarboxylase family protein [Nitriliruptor alkaliphilus]
MTTYRIDDRTVTMPVEVRDASAATVLFEVDATAGQELLPATFEVAETSPGRTNLAIALVDYRDNDLGAYLEVGIILFVQPTGGGEVGNFIVHLPVDQPFTCEAGRRIWGFPKTLQTIDRTDGAGTTTWTLTMDGEHVLTLTAPRGGDAEAPRLPMTSYTLIDGAPHATAFTQWGTGSGVVAGGAGVHLELGSHPVAKELASLGLPTGAALSTWTEHMQATFETPRPLA